MLYWETQAGGPKGAASIWKEVAVGKIWLDPNPHYFVLQKKKQADLYLLKDNKVFGRL